MQVRQLAGTWRSAAWMCCVAGCCLLGSGHAGISSAQSQDKGANSTQPSRLREGSQVVNQLGEFRETGGRIAFYPDDAPSSLHVLENLALERVARDLDRTRKWSVTGIITEFRGGNYLLLQRAVQKARSQRVPVPRS